MISNSITSSSVATFDTVNVAKNRDARPVGENPVASVSPPDAAKSAEKPETVEKAPAPVQQKEEAPVLADEMRDKVREAVDNVRDFIKKNQRSLDFEMAEESNRVIITVIDRETNKVIRRIPPEDLVSISEQIASGQLSSNDSMLFNVKA